MNSEGMPEKHELTEEAFVRALVPDPSNLPDAVFLSGFVGRSSREGFWRLYLTVDLNEFIEFHEADVLHAQPIGSPDSALSGQAVWVKRTSNLDRFTVNSLQMQTEFLQGDVAEAFAVRGMRGRQVRAGRLPAADLIGGPGLAADPTLFRANTCALSECISNFAICTNPGQRTCDPAFCFAAPAAFG